jgi:hypothetical protein
MACCRCECFQPHTDKKASYELLVTTQSREFCQLIRRTRSCKKQPHVLAPLRRLVSPHRVPHSQPQRPTCVIALDVRRLAHRPLSKATRIQHAPPYFLKTHFNIIFCIFPSSAHRLFQPEYCTYFSPPTCMLHASLIPSSTLSPSQQCRLQAASHAQLLKAQVLPPPPLHLITANRLASPSNCCLPRKCHVALFCGRAPGTAQSGLSHTTWHDLHTSGVKSKDVAVCTHKGSLITRRLHTVRCVARHTLRPTSSGCHAPRSEGHTGNGPFVKFEPSHWLVRQMNVHNNNNLPVPAHSLCVIPRIK